jgi:hypothetical protein
MPFLMGAHLMRRFIFACYGLTAPAGLFPFTFFPKLKRNYCQISHR